MRDRSDIQATRAVGRALLTALVISTALCGCGGDPMPPPNLLLISITGLRADRLACYGGSEETRGSQICRLGNPGLRYAWAFTPATRTSASAASLLTSLPPATHLVSGEPASFLRSEFQTLAERLSKAGYHTAAFVGDPAVNLSSHLDQGFDHFDDRPAAGHIGGNPVSINELATIASAWLANAPEPWLAWIHFGWPMKGYWPDEQSSASERARAITRQDIVIVAVDTAIEQILATPQGGDPRTGIVLLATQGTSLGERGESPGYGHGVSLEEIRVPLFWRPPAPVPDEAERGSREIAPLDVHRTLTDPVSTLDVLPTLLAAAGLAPDPTLEGHVLPRAAPDAEQAEALRARFLFSEHPDEVAVVSGRHYYARRRMPEGIPPESVEPDAPIGLTAANLRAYHARLGELRPPGLSPSDAAPAPLPSLERDLLGAGSPAPTLEFHLGRHLQAQRAGPGNETPPAP